jgi:hypothetical protein
MEFRRRDLDGETEDDLGGGTGMMASSIPHTADGLGLAVLLFALAVLLLIRPGKEWVGRRVAWLRCSVIVSRLGNAHALREGVPGGER